MQATNLTTSLRSALAFLFLSLVRSFVRCYTPAGSLRRGAVRDACDVAKVSPAGTVWHFDGTRWRGTPQPTAAEPVDPDAPPLEAILLPSQRLAAELARMGITSDESREKALSVPGAAPRSGESSLVRGR